MLNHKLIQRILLAPIENGAQKLCIVSGYAGHNMASLHIKTMQEKELPPIDIALVVGMGVYDGIRQDFHDGFKQLSSDPANQFIAQYVYQGSPVHSKIYVWLKDDSPFLAFTGSANYTQAGFGAARREYVVECDSDRAYSYFLNVEKDSINCRHAEVEDYIKLIQRSSRISAESQKPTVDLPERDEKSMTLSLLTHKGTPGHGSGLNWGHRKDGTKRDLNQTYIPLPSDKSKLGFFPLDGQFFTAVTDDNKQLILRVQQQNDKAIATPLNNALLGEYIRNRIGVPSGHFITNGDLEKYGRSDVTFYKIDDETFYMDFSVPNS